MQTETAGPTVPERIELVTCILAGVASVMMDSIFPYLAWGFVANLSMAFVEQDGYRVVATISYLTLASVVALGM